MKVIGLVGGVASGKSTVAKWFGQWGATVLDADRLAHEKLEEPEIRAELVARWGPQILAPDGKVDRRAIAQRVFGHDPRAQREREFLEQVVHPPIRRSVEQRIAQARQDEELAVVIDAPLLLEAGWERLCDLLLFVDTPLERRLAWAAARGWSAEQMTAREGGQLPIETKRGRCSHVLDNGGTRDALRAQARQFWGQWVVSSTG
jgi:dephospho-CoA kinase